MKIALVVPGGVDRSGQVRVIPCLLWLIERLARRHDLHVFALYQDSQPARFQLCGAHIHALGRPGPRLRAFAALVREHRRSPFALLHAFWAVPSGVIAAAFGRLWHRPVLLHLAGGELVDDPAIRYGGRLTARGRGWTSFGLRAATRVTAASRGMVEAAMAVGRRVEMLCLGVDTAKWPARAPRRRTGGVAQLLHVGSLNRVKDQHMLVSAAAALASKGIALHLDVAGTDTLSGAVQRHATELGITDRVTFHGFLPHERLRTLFERADLLVVSSRHEAGPVVFLEAAVAGVPTVGTAVGHIADWAPEAAVAVPVGDPDALAREIAALLRDEERRLSIARAAQQRAVRQDADWTAQRVLELYDELTAGRS